MTIQKVLSQFGFEIEQYIRQEVEMQVALALAKHGVPSPENTVARPLVEFKPPSQPAVVSSPQATPTPTSFDAARSILQRTMKKHSPHLYAPEAKPSISTPRPPQDIAELSGSATENPLEELRKLAQPTKSARASTTEDSLQRLQALIDQATTQKQKTPHASESVVVPVAKLNTVGSARDILGRLNSRRQQSLVG